MKHLKYALAFVGFVAFTSIVMTVLLVNFIRPNVKSDNNTSMMHVTASDSSSTKEKTSITQLDDVEEKPNTSTLKETDESSDILSNAKENTEKQIDTKPKSENKEFYDLEPEPNLIIDDNISPSVLTPKKDYSVYESRINDFEDVQSVEKYRTNNKDDYLAFLQPTLGSSPSAFYEKFGATDDSFDYPHLFFTSPRLFITFDEDRAFMISCYIDDKRLLSELVPYDAARVKTGGCIVKDPKNRVLIVHYSDYISSMLGLFLSETKGHCSLSFQYDLETNELIYIILSPLFFIEGSEARLVYPSLVQTTRP